MKEKELDEMLKLDNQDIEQKGIEKRIRKGVMKNVYMRIIIVFVITCIVIVTGYYGMILTLKATHYNPLKETSFVDMTPSNDEGSDGYGFNVLMQTFIAMYYPGYHYLGTHFEEERDLYKMYGQIYNSFNPLSFPGTNCTWTIQKSRLTADMNTDDNPHRIVAEYYTDDRHMDYDLLKVNDEMLQNIDDLPDSSVLDVSLSFPITKNAQQLSEFIKKYEDSTFVWVALKSEAGQIDEGMSLYDPSAYTFLADAQKKYPEFYLEGKTYTAEQLLQNYNSKLSLLLGSKDFVSLISSYDGNVSYESIQKRKQKLDKNGIEAIGIKGNIKKKELLKIIDNENIKNLYIKDVKLSMLER